MTSTCGGLDGPSFGFVNRDFIEAGKPDPHFNNYGAEERMWLCSRGRAVQPLVQARRDARRWKTGTRRRRSTKAPGRSIAPRPTTVRMTAHMKFAERLGHASFDSTSPATCGCSAPPISAKLFGAAAAKLIAEPA